MNTLVIISVYLTLMVRVLINSDQNTDVNLLRSVQDEFCLSVKKCGLVEDENIISPIVTNQTLIDIPVLSPLFPGYRCCKTSCSCDAQTCGIYDTCCLDTLQDIPTVEESEAMVRMTCHTPHARINVTHLNMARAPFSFKMFQRCPSDYLNTSIVQACEILNNDKKSFITDTPVTDTFTSYTYRNRFCALCNNVSEDRIKEWAALLKCTTESFKPKNIDNIFEEILQTETCNIIYEGNGIEQYEAIKCDNVIRTCNETGKWRVYNPLIEKACLAYTSVYDYIYKNVFCYMCNTNDIQGKSACYGEPGVRVDISFVALLHVTPDEVKDIAVPETTNKCQTGEMYDEYKKICRGLSCLFPKALRNGSCVYMMETLGGVRYKIFLKLSANDTVDDSTQDAADILQVILSKIMSAEPVGDISIKAYKSAETLAFNTSAETLNQIKNETIVYIQMQTNAVELMGTETIDMLLTLDNGILVIPGNTNDIQYNINIGVFKFTDESRTRLYDQRTQKFYNQVNAVFSERTTVPFWSNTYEEFLIIPLYNCSMISLNSTEFSAKRKPHGVFLEELNAMLEDADVLIDDSNNKTDDFEFRICADRYESLIEQYIQRGHVIATSSDDDTSVSIEGVVSVVCAIISMFLLAVTIVTYAIYKDLRSQPGVNNIILCASVFVAQGLFQFGVGQSKNVSETVCKVLGILIHFSWLFVLFWMNVCCIHMVRVFRRTRIMAAKKISWKLTTVYVLHCVFGSGVFVVLNILISLFVLNDTNNNIVNHNNSDIGYGGTLCYITNNKMVAYCFVIPVGMLILVNISLYVFVIMKIRSKSEFPSEQNSSTVERNYFKIYMKLSTLTGGTWLFGFLYLLWQIGVIEYIFIIFNASHGTLLFLSFVCNKRSLSLYRESFYKVQSTLASNTNS